MYYRQLFYYIANSSWHWGSYGSIWTDLSPKKYYMDWSFWGPYNIFLVTDRSIYCHMTLSAMNYLLYYTFYLKYAGTVPEPNRKRGSPVPVHITLYWPAALTKTNRENKNVKYNIGIYYLQKCCKRNIRRQLDKHITFHRYIAYMICLMTSK